MAVQCPGSLVFVRMSWKVVMRWSDTLLLSAQGLFPAFVSFLNADRFHQNSIPGSNLGGHWSQNCILMSKLTLEIALLRIYYALLPPVRLLCRSLQFLCHFQRKCYTIAYLFDVLILCLSYGRRDCQMGNGQKSVCNTLMIRRITQMTRRLFFLNSAILASRADSQWFCYKVTKGLNWIWAHQYQTGFNLKQGVMEICVSYVWVPLWQTSFHSLLWSYFFILYLFHTLLLILVIIMWERTEDSLWDQTEVVENYESTA